MHFEKVSLGAVEERKRTGEGHGQGTEQLGVSRSLAEFAVNVAGTINPFLIKRWLEIRFEEEPDENELAFWGYLALLLCFSVESPIFTSPLIFFSKPPEIA